MQKQPGSNLFKLSLSSVWDFITSVKKTHLNSQEFVIYDETFLIAAKFTPGHHSQGTEKSSESCAGSVELDPFHSKLLLTEGLFLKCCVLQHFLFTFSPTCCYPFLSHDFETFFASYNFQLFSIQYFRQLNEITEMQGS